MVLREIVLAALLAASAVVDALICDQCLLYNNNVCVQAGTCQGEYCLYEYVTERSAPSMLKKSCLNTNIVVFDDNSQLTTFNQCVSKSTATKNYIVKLCNTGNYCNRQCDNIQPVQPRSTCYQCASTDGTECFTGQCTGDYCTYINQRTSYSRSIVKGCTSTPAISYDDGSRLTTVGLCQAYQTANSYYIAEICQGDFCNGPCSPSGGNNYPTQSPYNPNRSPTVTCYACERDNAYDCTSGTCQGNYCLYERRTGTDGIPHVKRSCSLLGYAVYPDGTTTQYLGQCEYRNFQGTTYATNICNSASYCATQCNGAATDSAGTIVATVISLAVAAVLL